MTAYTYSLLAALVWGIAPLFEKPALAHMRPMTGLLFRSMGVLLGSLFLLRYFPDGAQWRAMGVKPALCIAGAGLLASVIGQIFAYNAIQQADISQVTPVMGAWPLLAVILGWLFLHEPLTTKKILGAASIVAGVWLLKP